MNLLACRLWAFHSFLRGSESSDGGERPVGRVVRDEASGKEYETSGIP